jgi:nicotinate-nucleotide pyrophosphorylase (carboxylating)
VAVHARAKIFVVCAPGGAYRDAAMDDSSAYLHRIVAFALAEDLGSGDVTSKATVPSGLRGRGVIVARQDGILSGAEVVDAVYAELGGHVALTWTCEDGDRLRRGAEVARLEGPLAELLAGERVALNFLAHLSGIATLTRRYVEAVDGHQARILDTRKTTPGLRHLEKYAVRCGGGENHRIGLYDMILVKENHIRAAGDVATATKAALAEAAKKRPRLPVEVEVQTVADAVAVARLGPDRIMLDNMAPAEMTKAVLAVRDVSARAGTFVALEASGNVTLANAHAVAATGVDFISVGALTHSAPAFDFSLLIQ